MWVLILPPSILCLCCNSCWPSICKVSFALIQQFLLEGLWSTWIVPFPNLLLEFIPVRLQLSPPLLLVIVSPSLQNAPSSHTDIVPLLGLKFWSLEGCVLSVQAPTHKRSRALCWTWTPSFTLCEWYNSWFETPSTWIPGASLAGLTFFATADDIAEHTVESLCLVGYISGAWGGAGWWHGGSFTSSHGDWFLPRMVTTGEGHCHVSLQSWHLLVEVLWMLGELWCWS